MKLTHCLRLFWFFGLFSLGVGSAVSKAENNCETDAFGGAGSGSIVYRHGESPSRLPELPAGEEWLLVVREAEEPGARIEFVNRGYQKARCDYRHGDEFFLAPEDVPELRLPVLTDGLEWIPLAQSFGGTSKGRVYVALRKGTSVEAWLEEHVVYDVGSEHRVLAGAMSKLPGLPAGFEWRFHSQTHDFGNEPMPGKSEVYFNYRVFRAEYLLGDEKLQRDDYDAPLPALRHPSWRWEKVRSFMTNGKHYSVYQVVRSTPETE